MYFNSWSALIFSFLCDNPDALVGSGDKLSKVFNDLRGWLSSDNVSGLQVSREI